MPIHRVRGPDGKVHKFRFDDDVSQDEVMAYAEQVFSGKSGGLSSTGTKSVAEPKMTEPAAPERPPEKWYEDFGEGIGSSLLDTYYGVKDLIPGVELDEEDRARMKDWKEDAGQSGWGTAGRIVGEIGQLAVPGSLGLKGAKALNAVGKMGRTAKALPLAADVGGSAGLGYVQLPDDGATRGQEAFQGGAAALAGGLVGKAVAPLFRGVKGNKVTEALRDEGANLTPGQIKGGIFQRLEDYGEYLVPSLSRAIQKSKTVADQGMERTVLKKIGAPDPKTLLTDEIKTIAPKETGWDGIKEVQKAFYDGYEKAWGRGTALDNNAVFKINKLIDGKAKGLAKKDRRILKDVKEDMIQMRSDDPNISPKELDELVRNYVSAKPETFRVDRALQDIRDSIRGNIPAKNREALNALDEAWPRMLAVEKAAGTGKSSLERGLMKPLALATGSKGVANKAKFARGEGPLQKMASDWDQLKGKPPGMLMTEARRLVTMFPDLPGLTGLGNVLAGNKATQAQIRKALQQEMIKNLRLGISTARVGGAYEGDEY